jgi:hypothetical protein
MIKKISSFTAMRRLVISLFSLGMIATACSKGGSSDNGGSGGVHGDPSPIDTIAPVLTINTPTSNQIFQSGNTINVTGLITDDLGLFRGNIRITDDANGSVLKTQDYEIHYVLSYNYNISYVPSVTVPSNYTVTVYFQDHGYNTTTKSVKIKVNP